MGQKEILLKNSIFELTGKMLRFVSKEFESKLVEAIRLLKERDQFEFFICDDLIDPTEAGFNPGDYDDQVVGWDDLFSVSLLDMSDNQAITYRDFIDLAKELEQIEFRNQIECWTNKRFLLRVEFSGAEKFRSFWKLARKGSEGPPHPVFPIETKWESRKYHCALVHGITPFAVAVLKNGNYEDYYPPVLENEFFVEVRCDSQISEEDGMKIAQAYLFEISASAGVYLFPSPREIIDYDFWEEEGEDKEKLHDSEWNPRLRPLLLGKGMADVISLYNAGVRAQDSSIQILFFTKVIEFISQTVVRRKVTELGRLKLLSARALDPDADYVKDLQKFFEDQRKYRQDQEAIKLTVKECCDPYELKPKAPKFLNYLYDLGSDATQGQKDEAMAQFGESLSATRNMIVHAKANYAITGKECPLDQISQFAQCSQLAAEEAVRWYHSQHENIRIV